MRAYAGITQATPVQYSFMAGLCYDTPSVEAIPVVDCGRETAWLVRTIARYATRSMEAFWVVLWPDLCDPDDVDDA